MRLKRLGLVFIAFYLTFLGGSTYYSISFPIRVFHHVIVTLLLGLWLLRRIRSRKDSTFGLPDTPLNLPIYAAIAVWIITAMMSWDPRMSFEHLWFPATHVIFFFVLVDLFQRGYQRMVFETIFIMATLVVFITGLELASWYFGLGIIPGTSTNWATAPFAPPRLPLVSLAMGISTLLAGYVAPLITVAITWALTSKRRDYRITLWILAGLLMLVLLLTFSRGGLLSLIGGIGTFAILRAAQYPHLTRRISPRVIIGTGILIGVIGVLTFVILTLPFSRGKSDEGRVDMWRSAIAITVDHPITGVGPGLFGRAFRSYRDPTIARDKLASAHNAYLNTASETGIAGIAVSIWIGIVLLRTAYRTWKQASHPIRRLRIEGTLAAFIGIAFHSMVDVFTITPIVLLILALTAYAIIGHRSRLDPVTPGKRLPATLLFIIIIGYGIAFVQFDRAQSQYEVSLNNSDHSTRLIAVEAAARIDPHLHLYQLHRAMLSSNEADLFKAIAAYEHALELEPTWDVGWINLAALMEQNGNIDIALSHLETAGVINTLNTAALHWARLAELQEGTPDEKVIAAYYAALTNQFNQFPPFADFWWEIPLRREAVRQYLATQSPELNYRILNIHNPDRAREFVPAVPETAAEWWIAGEHMLRVEGNIPKAIESFTRAIELSPRWGDYYASRARAYLNYDPEAALSDLDMAALYGTLYEYPNTIRAALTDILEEAQWLKANALPIHSAGQEFAAVLFSRRAAFDVVPAMRFPGPGREALSPWYDLAYSWVETEQTDQAIKAFQFILENAPFETEAQEQLDRLKELRQP